MKRLIITLTITLCFSVVYCQTLIKGGLNYQFMNKTLHSEIGAVGAEFEPTEFDSIFIQKTLEGERFVEYAQEPELGFFAGIDLRKKFKNRFSFETGLNVNFSKFEFKDTLWNTISQKVISTDTITFRPDPNGSEPFCIFTNDFSDFAQIDRRRFLSIYHLIVPARINYELIPNELFFSVGGYFTTNIYSVHRTQELGVDVHETTTGRECTLFIDNISEKNEKYFSSLNYGATLGIEYWIDNLGFEIMVDKRLTNLFGTGKGFEFGSIQTIQTRNVDTKPLHINFLIKLQLGKKIIQAKKLE